MERRINVYDIQNIDTLRESMLPISYKLSMIIGDSRISEVECNRAMVSAITHLEEAKNDLMEEIKKYKMVFGELPKN